MGSPAENHISMTFHLTAAEIAGNLTDADLRELLIQFSDRKLLTALGPRFHALNQLLLQDRQQDAYRQKGGA